VVEDGKGTKKSIRSKINFLLPPVDPEVKKAVKEQDNRDEYFDIKNQPLKGKNGVYIVNQARF
jgi:hypothetical protein